MTNFLRTKRPRPLICTLTDVEVASALSRELSIDELVKALNLYDRNKERGVVQQMQMPAAIFASARQLVLQFRTSHRLRTLDALQLATARHYGVDIFATYDGDLATLAYKLSLYVVGARP